ncbi:MAG: S8 family serine peptidase [Bacteroidota bacterium]
MAPLSILAQPTVQVDVVDVDALRLSDFDITRPAFAPVLLIATITNDERPRPLRLLIDVTGQANGYLGQGRILLGTMTPGEVRMVTNRDITQFALSDVGDTILDRAFETGVLPPDLYSYAVTLEDLTRGQPVAEEVGEVETTNPGNELDLVGPGLPFDQPLETLASPFPLFQWFTQSTSVDFALYEVRPGQVAPEDVVTGQPVFRQDEIEAQQLLYPSFAEPLQPGMTYAWQVEARVQTAAGLERIPSPVYRFQIEAVEDAITNLFADGTAADPAGFDTPARTDPPPAQRLLTLSVEPQEAYVSTGEAVAFSYTSQVEGVDTLLTDVQWTVEPADAGTVDATGRFTAGQQPGFAAVRVQWGDDEDVQDYASVIISAPDAQPQVTLLSPADAATNVLPYPLFTWLTEQLPTGLKPRYRVQLWAASTDGGVPQGEPLWQATTEQTTLTYPASAPVLEEGASYAARVDLLGANNALLAQSEIAAFTQERQGKVAWELFEAWDDAQQTGTDDSSLTLLLEIIAPGLNGATREQLGDSGAQIEYEEGVWVQVSAPFTALADLAAFPFVRTLSLPAPPQLNGEVAADLGAAVPPTATAPMPTRAPVRMAVMEFGFDEGVLPTILGDRTYTTRSFRPDRRISPNRSAANHGTATLTALAEHLDAETTVHLLNFSTEVEFLAALRHAVDELNVQIITCSVWWMQAFDDYDGTSSFAQQIDQIVSGKALFVAAAGNFARSHWEAAFTDADDDAAHEFAGGQNYLSLDLSSDQVYQFLVTWDDWDALAHDLDIVLFDEEGSPILRAPRRPYASRNKQGPGQFERPLELIRGFRPPYAGVRSYRLVVEHRKPEQLASSVPTFEVYTYPAPEAAVPAPEARSSLSWLATTRSVLPVTAEDYADGSQGPTNDDRLRPDFAAEGQVLFGNVERQGTSFAAPRVAAAFALIYAANPEWSQDEATLFLRQFTSSPGEKNPRSGWGEVDFDALKAALSQ